MDTVLHGILGSAVILLSIFTAISVLILLGSLPFRYFEGNWPENADEYMFCIIWGIGVVMVLVILAGLFYGGIEVGNDIINNYLK